VDIRPHQPADQDALIALWEACGLTRPWNDPRLDIARKSRVNPEWFLIGEHDGQLVASAMFGYEGHRGWVNHLAVAPQHRHRGWARDLMAQGEALLRAVGCAKINLQVRQGNDDALAFYQAIGYGVDASISLGKRLIPDQ
jgi:ribosomal protein S18 acetylase RimI-like enzyme